MTVVRDETMRCGGARAPYGVHPNWIAHPTRPSATVRRRVAVVAATAGLTVLAAPLAAGASALERAAAAHEGKQPVLVQMEADLKGQLCPSAQKAGQLATSLPAGGRWMRAST